MFKPTALINKHIKNLRVRSHHYIKNRGEPKDNTTNNTLLKDETVLTGSSVPMRRKFRHIAQQIRIIKNNNINK